MSKQASEVRIDAERIRLLYAHGRTNSFVPLAAGLLMVVGFWDRIPPLWLLSWYAMVCLNQIARLLLLRAFNRRQPRDEDTPRWGWPYCATMIVGGTLLGNFLFLLPTGGDYTGFFVVVIVMTGFAAGSIASNAYHPPSLVGYLFAIITPTLIAIWLTPGRDFLVLGLLYALYLLTVTSFARNQIRLIRDSITMKHQNIDLIEDLKEKTATAEAAQRRAEQASVAKSQFFTAASHDLRQPLHALGLFASSLKAGARDADDVRRVDQVLMSVDALSALFAELLDISKLDSGYITPDPKHFPIQPLFGVLQVMYAPAAEKKGIGLRFVATNAVVNTDKVLLERVLANLISNAIRYTEHGGVCVGCRRRGDRYVLEVWDTGCGIGAEYHERIFDEFFQINNPERDRTRGLGLGLAIVRRIGALIGCPVTMNSRPGRGSVFRISLPRGDATLVKPELHLPGEEDIDILRERVIVVVEDEAAVREGMREIFAGWHCNSVIAATAEEAIARLDDERLHPDAIVSDYRLREQTTGQAAIALIRTRFGSEIPAMLISGDTSQELYSAARESNLILLHKPVRPARLRAALLHLLKSSSIRPTG